MSRYYFSGMSTFIDREDREQFIIDMKIETLIEEIEEEITKKTAGEFVFQYMKWMKGCQDLDEFEHLCQGNKFELGEEHYWAICDKRTLIRVLIQNEEEERREACF